LTARLLPVLIVRLARGSVGPAAKTTSSRYKSLPGDVLEMADYTPYQQKVIKRYYSNLDAIKLQRLAELATDIYLAEGRQRDQLWTKVEQNLRKIEFPESRIVLLLRQRDPALLVEILKELERGA
jgi:hypothetical protein